MGFLVCRKLLQRVGLSFRESYEVNVQINILSIGTVRGMIKEYYEIEIIALS